MQKLKREKEGKEFLIIEPPESEEYGLVLQ